MKTETRTESKWEGFDPRSIERAVLFRLDTEIDFNSDTGRNRYSLGQLEKTDGGYQIGYFDRVGESKGSVDISNDDIGRILSDDTTLSARFASYVEQINELSGNVRKKPVAVRVEEPSPIEEVVANVQVEDSETLIDVPGLNEAEPSNDTITKEKKAEPRYVEPDWVDVAVEGARYTLGGARAVGRAACKVGRAIYNVGHVWPGATLFMPSIARKLGDESEDKILGVALTGAGALFTSGFPLAMASSSHSTTGFLTYDMEHLKTAGAVLAISNGLSLVYEIGRHIKKRAGLRLGEEIEDDADESMKGGYE